MSRCARIVIITLVLAAILVPLVPLVLWSFADTWPFVQVLPNFSLRAWTSTFQNSKVVGALINSLILCVVIVGLSFALSFFAAKNIGTREFKGKRLLQLLLLVPSFFPQIALVFGMQKVFSKIGLYNNIVGVVVALLVFYVPYMTLLMSAVFEDYDLDLERQAASLGVRPLKRLFFVTLPAVRSGAIVSCIFSFIGVWAAYLVVSIVAPPSFKTMSLLAFPMISSASNGYAMTACVTILYIAPIIGVLAVFSRCLANDTSHPEDSKPGGIM